MKVSNKEWKTLLALYQSGNLPCLNDTDMRSIYWTGKISRKLLTAVRAAVKTRA